MIDLNFGLFWAGSNLSYLRYLTFKSLRHFHPHSRIQLYKATQFERGRHRWNREKQEFENPQAIQTDYTHKLKALGVEIITFDFFAQYPPNYQSDFFRWWYLYNHGGFYLDTDQIILKSFDKLPLDNRMIYSSYGGYDPVGVIGAERKDGNIKKIMNALPKHYNPNDYNSLGPWMMRDMLKKLNLDRCFNAPQRYFYPIPISDYMVKAFRGEFEIPNKSFALHWFGGHPNSQKFNASYTKQFAMKSNDTISVFLRENNIL